MCTFRTISNLSPALCLLLLHKCTLHSVPDAHLKPADRPAPGITDFWSLNLRNKCCGHGEFLAFLDDLLHPHCVISTDQLQRKINASEWSRSFQQSGTLYERMWCSRSSEVRLLRQSDAPHYHLLADGSVRHRHTDRSSYRTVCGDLVDVDGQLMQSLTAGDLAALDQNYSTVVLCERGRDETFEKILLNSGLAISLCFLVVTLLLGLCTPELRQRVHHECLLRYVAALIVAFVSIICIQNWDIYNTCCSFGAYMTQYWYLSAFSWRTVTYIHLWRSIKGFPRDILYSASRTTMIYSLYAWGCPLIVSFATIAANNLLDENSPFNPGFGEESCWFKQGDPDWPKPIFIYFLSFVLLTLLVNLILFIDMILILRSNDKLWEESMDTGSKRHKKNKSRFSRYLMVFSAMSLIWLTDLISYYLENDRWTLIWLNLGNILHVIIIFLTFFFSNKIYFLVGLH